MTKQPSHCYRHVPRHASRWLLSAVVRLTAAVAWACVGTVTLASGPADAPSSVVLPVLLSGAAEMPAFVDSGPSASEEIAALVREEREDLDEVVSLASALEACPNRLPRQQRWRVARLIQEESEEHGYDPLFIAALVQVESGCSPTARGGGAVGLVQMLPSTARGVARRAGLPWRGERSLTEPASSLRLGLKYLGELEEMFGDPYKAVAAYNLGPGPVMRMSSQRAQRTQYVRKVLSRYEELRGEYA